jgi:hypothetical protein
MPTLDDEDIATAVALMVRLVRVQNERNRVGEIKKEVDEKYVAINLQWNRCRDALAILGFDTSSKDIWSDIKAAIGMPNWNAAFERAKASPLPLTPILAVMPPIPPPPPPVSPGNEEWDDGEPDELTDTAFEGVEEPPQSVREFVIEALKTHGQKGTKAADIRAAYESARGMKLHDKTIGMTLYRLSKEEPPLARREGRIWFFVEPNGGTKNPGGGTPGLSELFE